MKNKETKKGFTLAETLIALAVLGILAAVTVPVLVQSTSKHAYVDGLKSAYLTLKTATSQLSANNGGTMANISTVNGHATLLTKYCSQLNCIKNCGTAASSGCFPNTMYKRLDGTNWTNIDSQADRAKAILANGSLIYLTYSDNSCNIIYGTGPASKTCGWLYVDINGYKTPNQLGRDVFAFWITKTGITPAGLYSDLTDCTTTGVGCTGKILTEGTMNY